MLRTLVVLCLMAAPAFGREIGFKVTFGVNPFTAGKDHFIPLPMTTTEADSSSWEMVTQPTPKSGYENTTLWCQKDDRTLGVFYDDTGNAVGLQIALNPDYSSEVIYDWTAAGFTQWNDTVNETTTTYWTTQQYYVSADYLATNASTRTANRNSEYLVQGDYYYVSGFNGSLLAIPTDVTELATNSNYKEQSCIYGMGNHYYYNMTENLTCSVDTIATYFPLVYNKQAIGVGFMLPIKYTVPSDKTNYFESPTKSAIQMIVPKGPECLYDYGDSPGVLTMHTYFIKDPYYITCLW